MTITSIRFMGNNYATASTLSASTENSSYPIENAVDTVRSRLYKPTSKVFWLDFDFGYQASCTFLGIIGAKEEIFTISDSATITIKGNNVASFSSPAFEETLTRSDDGIFAFFDDTGGAASYRYWRINVDDSSNPEIPSIGYVYLGDYITITERNINRGFTKRIVDNSIMSQAINGTTYSQQFSRYTRFENLGLGYMPAADRRELEQFMYDFGKYKPFFVSLDPDLDYSTEYGELTKFCIFEGEPQLTNWTNDVYSMSFSLREVI